MPTSTDIALVKTFRQLNRFNEHMEDRALNVYIKVIQHTPLGSFNNYWHNLIPEPDIFHTMFAYLPSLNDGK